MTDQAIEHAALILMQLHADYLLIVPHPPPKRPPPRAGRIPAYYYKVGLNVQLKDISQLTEARANTIGRFSNQFATITTAMRVPSTWLTILTHTNRVIKVRTSEIVVIENMLY